MRGQNLGRKEGGDPDVKHRTGKPDANDNVGTTQDAMVQLHQHYYKLATAATLSKGSAAAGPTVDPTEPTTSLLDIKPTNVPFLDWGHETRPVNIYVNYLIKYTVEPAHIVPIGIEENPPKN